MNIAIDNTVSWIMLRGEYVRAIEHDVVLDNSHTVVIFVLHESSVTA